MAVSIKRGVDVLGQRKKECFLLGALCVVPNELPELHVSMRVRACVRAGAQVAFLWVGYRE